MTPAGTGEALLRDIIANPGDDALRLIYADFLEDSGQGERAEFIRVQVELYAMEESAHDGVVSHLALRGWQTPAAGCTCRPCSLRRRERAAWRAKDAASGGFIIPPAEVPGMGMPDFLFSEQTDFGRGALVWRRGFVHAARCNLNTWLNHGPALVRQHPMEEVKITDKRPVREEDVYAWYWEETGDGYSLPNAIWCLLPGGGNDAAWKHYATEKEANAALPRALLAWARAAKD